MTCGRLGLVIFALWMVVLPARPARADDESKKICASAFASAQRLMRSGNLLEAKSKLELCGGPQCPALMHPDCQQWLSRVDASIATLVFQVASATEKPVGEVRISVDGGEPIVLTDGPMSFNPGAHDLTFTATDFRTLSKHLVVSDGEKLRPETVTLVPSEPAPRQAMHTSIPASRTEAVVAEPLPRRISLPIVIASSVAVAAGISAVYFGVKARSDDHGLDSCAPTSSCARSAVDNVRREYLWTNVSIGVAAAGLATAAVWFLVDSRSSDRPAARLTLFVNPTAMGPAAVGRF